MAFSGTKSAILAAIAALLMPDGAGNLLLNQGPAQFDNSLRLASTAYAYSMIGNLRPGASLTVNTALTAAQCGGYFDTPTAGITVTMPVAASTPNGAAILIFNNSGGIVTLVAGNFNTSYGFGVATINIPPNSCVYLVNDQTSWCGFGGAGAAGVASTPQSGAGMSQWTNIPISPGTGGAISLPAGGRWAYAYFNQVGVQSGAGVAAGGTVLLTGAAAGSPGISDAAGFCWRIA